MTLQQAITFGLQASILMTVFGFGLEATVGDVLRLARRPSLLGRSLVSMFVIMPVIAIALAGTFAFRPSVEIALMALSISPIPPILPGKERKAGGDTSYGLGLMAIIGALSIVIVPAAVQLLSLYFGRSFAIAPGAVAKAVLSSVIVPLGAGMLVRAILPALAVRIANPIGRVASVLLLLGVLAILAGTLSSVLALIGNGTVVAFGVFAAAGLAVGHSFGGPEEDDRVVLALSTAARHPAIALAAAKTVYPDEPNLVASILLYLLVNALVGFPYLAWRRGRIGARRAS